MASPLMQVRPAGRLIGGFLALAVFGLVVVWYSLDRSLGTTAVLFGGILAVAGLAGAIPGRRYIQGDTEGVTIVRNFRSRRLIWADVEQVTLELQPVRESSLPTARFHMRAGEAVDVSLVGLAGKPDRIVGALNAVRENRFR